MYRTSNTNWAVSDTTALDVKTLGKALIWLAAGVLLGLVVGVPYDRLLGLPSGTGTLLGAVVWAVLLGMSYPRRIAR
jgi:hypothetical protein